MVVRGNTGTAPCGALPLLHTPAVVCYGRANGARLLRACLPLGCRLLCRRSTSGRIAVVWYCIPVRSLCPCLCNGARIWRRSTAARSPIVPVCEYTCRKRTVAGQVSSSFFIRRRGEPRATDVHQIPSGIGRFFFIPRACVEPSLASFSSAVPTTQLPRSPSAAGLFPVASDAAAASYVRLNNRHRWCVCVCGPTTSVTMTTTTMTGVGDAR